MSKQIRGNQKHLTQDNRITIEKGLDAGTSLRQIASSIGKDPSTISYEVKKHRILRPHPVNDLNLDGFHNKCTLRGSCKKKNICNSSGDPCRRLCKSCPRCNSVCNDFTPKDYHCPLTDKAPFVCNGCKNKSRCRLDKAFYRATIAHREYRTILSQSRDGNNISEEELALLDDKNKKIEAYKDYAERIVRELREFYNDSEAKIREKLENTINNIFKTIYEGGLSLTIDEKYHISVYANDFDGDVETSTAQSISVIFAFITGVIQLARENRTAEDEEAKLLSSEPYPLVMDAPLSAFDKRRIKTVCTTLPTVADQVIIFIKDTDGDLAEEYMGDYIGSRHRLEKQNEFITQLN